MKITNLKVNGIVNPLGWQLEHPIVTFLAEETNATAQTSAQVRVALDEAMEQVVYDSGMQAEISGTGFELPLELAPSTRYYWTAAVTNDLGETAESDPAWFETSREVGEDHLAWSADWITPETDKETRVCMRKNVTISKPVAKARMYMVGLGMYEFYLNGEKQGEECLLPGFCNYDAYIPYQTFPVTLADGENKIHVMLGSGWYKGWYGLHKKKENYGDRFALIAELHIWYTDGTKEIVGTDETWNAVQSPVVYDGIYSGEIFDARWIGSECSCSVAEACVKAYADGGITEPATGEGIPVCGNDIAVKTIDLDQQRLVPRLNPRLQVNDRLKPIEVITTPKGETVLDMGQNMVGWLEFSCDVPRDHEIRLQFGEILQDGCFYNDNLRSAPAEFTYISDGTARVVRQHFTFYGFRFVKVEGWIGELHPEDFTGLVIHSEMERIGEIETSDKLVNQLIHNAWWGQKGNFLDVPTDCPQRDERYGWTGDAQIFSGTALFNADAAAFYTKYGKDLYSEQQVLGGGVPDVVPTAGVHTWMNSAAWGDAATIIPWNVYVHTGNKEILRRQFPSMKGWVDYIKSEDDKYGSKRLWLSGFQYGDWLALDGKVEGGVYGATDPHFIASAYYYYSTALTAKAARVLAYEDEAVYYETLAKEIREAFFREYYTPSGKLAVDTMTGYVVALYMDLTPEYAYEKNREGLRTKLAANNYHLQTGFVGTAYLCRVLSDHGMNDIAYRLVLEKGFPGWLYEVLMGATTVWERWNSVLPNGKISGTEMNSLNHYAYGSIVEWMYRDMLGICPSEDAPGFREFTLAPKPNYQIRSAKGQVRMASGMVKSAWEIGEDGSLNFRFTVPFNTKATMILPDAEVAWVEELLKKQKVAYVLDTCEDRVYKKSEIQDDCRYVAHIYQDGSNVVIHVTAGTYAFTYQPTTPYRKIYSIDTPLEELKQNPQTREVLESEYFTACSSFPFEKELCTLREHLNGPFTSLPHEKQAEMDRQLREI